MPVTQCASMYSIVANKPIPQVFCDHKAISQQLYSYAYELLFVPATGCTLGNLCSLGLHPGQDACMISTGTSLLSYLADAQALAAASTPKMLCKPIYTEYLMHCV